MSKKAGAPLSKEAPWRAHSGAGNKPFPRINHPPFLAVSQTQISEFALSLVKHPDPVGSGLAMEAMLESAGPDCVVPGTTKPVKVLGLKIWPVDVDLTFAQRAGQELKILAKTMETAVDVMNRSFLDR